MYKPVPSSGSHNLETKRPCQTRGHARCREVRFPAFHFLEGSTFAHINIGRPSRAGFAFLGVNTPPELGQAPPSRWLPLRFVQARPLPAVPAWPLHTRMLPTHCLKALVSQSLHQCSCASFQGIAAPMFCTNCRVRRLQGGTLVPS